MRTGPAFEFLGSMGGAGAGAAYKLGDVFAPLLNNGAGLLGTVGDVVTLMGLKQQTRLLELNYNSISFTSFIDKCKKNAEKEISIAEDAEHEKHDTQSVLKRSHADELIQKAANELKAAQELYRRECESIIANTGNKMASTRQYDMIKRRARNFIKDIILLSTETKKILQENEIANRLKIAELDEIIRREMDLFSKEYHDII